MQDITIKVFSREGSLKLKELGFDQPTKFWYLNDFSTPTEIIKLDNIRSDVEMLKAPTKNEFVVWMGSTEWIPGMNIASDEIADETILDKLLGIKNSHNV